MQKCVKFVFCVTAIAFAPATLGRNVYLNGVDISSAVNQKLEKVDVHVGPNGDIFISASNYEVHEETSYVPLSQPMKDLESPMHTEFKRLGEAAPAVGTPVVSAPAVAAPEPSKPNAEESKPEPEAPANL